MNVMSWIIDQRDAYIRSGGIIISEEWEAEREKICDGCSFNGMVSPDGILASTPGCEACACPFSTKRMMHKHYRKKGKAKEPLTPKELIEIKTLKNILPSRFEEVVIECSHPGGNRWDEIDQKFSKIINHECTT